MSNTSTYFPSDEDMQDVTTQRTQFPEGTYPLTIQSAEMATSREHALPMLVLTLGSGTENNSHWPLKFYQTLPRTRGSIYYFALTMQALELDERRGKAIFIPDDAIFATRKDTPAARRAKGLKALVGMVVIATVEHNEVEQNAPSSTWIDGLLGEDEPSDKPVYITYANVASIAHV